jgi:type I restriction enzyme S subunit
MIRQKAQQYFLRDVLKIRNGRDHKHLKDGSIPVYGSGGIMRFVNQAIYTHQSILLPRKGTLDNIQFVKDPFWSVDTAFYTEIDKSKVAPYYLYYLLRQLDISRLWTGTGVPSMTSEAYYNIKISLPDLPTQLRIAAIMEWFVFRGYDGWGQPPSRCGEGGRARVLTRRYVNHAI